MNSGNYLVGSNLRHSLTNAGGKYSAQFMSRSMRNENLSIKRTLEDSVGMEGYEVNVRKPVIRRTDIQQPMAGHSEYWIG